MLSSSVPGMKSANSSESEELGYRPVSSHSNFGRVYLAAGAVEVWVLDPDAQTIAKHTATGVSALCGGELLTSELLPGFRVAVSHFFAE